MFHMFGEYCEREHATVGTMIRSYYKMLWPCYLLRFLLPNGGLLAVQINWTNTALTNRTQS